MFDVVFERNILMIVRSLLSFKAISDLKAN